MKFFAFKWFIAPLILFGAVLMAGRPAIANNLLPHEKSISYAFADGVTIKVHFDDRGLKRAGENALDPKDVLDAAVYAYQTLTDFLGFSERGFSFAYPDTNYAYDPDKTLDIYLGDSKQFAEAPCFDTLRVSDRGYQAMILLPVDYARFIQNWEKLNPSPLGRRRVEVDLKGTLMHEMLHAILFYCHKNLEAAQAPGLGQTDWYVEGLARYLETFVGAKHDFYSQGFHQALPGKIRFSRGGSNYFMRYPDQGFLRLRYENALFWRYFESRYGMKGIVQFGRELRGRKISEMPLAFQRVTRAPFERFLEDYAFCVLSKDFDLKEDGQYLSDVATTKLYIKNKQFYLIDGEGVRVLLGKTSGTDWIGEWSEHSSRHGEASVAGDGTREADVSGWSTDYFELSWDPSSGKVLPDFTVANNGGRGDFSICLAILTQGGNWLKSTPLRVPINRSGDLSIQRLLEEKNLSLKDASNVYVLITNLDPEIRAEYHLSIRNS